MGAVGIAGVSSTVSTGWTAAIRFDCDKKLILIETKRIMMERLTLKDELISRVYNYFRRRYINEQLLTRLRDHEHQPTRDEFDKFVADRLVKIDMKYDYGITHRTEHGVTVHWDRLQRQLGVTRDEIDELYDRVVNEIRPQYAEADEFIQFRISDELKKPHNQIPRELTIAKIITGNEQLNARDLTLRLDHWLGTHTIQQWINIFRERWRDERARDERAERQRQRQEERNRQRVRQERTVAYPFKSKATAYIKMNPDAVYEPLVSDAAYSKRELKMLKRPYYSKYPGCWEIDHAFNIAKEDDSWLFCVNVNTRYLVVYEAAETKTQVLRCLTDLISRFEVRSVRGDGSAAYSTSNVNDDATFTQRDLDRYDESRRNAPLMIKFYKDNNINVYFNGGKFTNHNRLVDVTIKTIRNAIGYRLLNSDQVQEIVDYYNHTPHKGLKMLGDRGFHFYTPHEVQHNRDLEWEYIRMCDERLMNVLRYQQMIGMQSYERGNILMVHLDLGKTDNRDEKRRRHFDRLGEFIEYVNGNVRVRLNKPVRYGQKNHDVVVIPIYFTKFVSKNAATIPAEVVRVYGRMPGDA